MFKRSIINHIMEYWSERGREEHEHFIHPETRLGYDVQLTPDQARQFHSLIDNPRSRRLYLENVNIVPAVKDVELSSGPDEKGEWSDVVPFTYKVSFRLRLYLPDGKVVETPSLGDFTFKGVLYTLVNVEIETIDVQLTGDEWENTCDLLLKLAVPYVQNTL